MLLTLLTLLTGCGRIAFELASSPPDSTTDGMPIDGASDGATDGMASDGPTIRACHSDVRYQTAAGLANTYREGVELVSWDQARTLCKAEDADLWVVESDTERAAFTGDWTGITDVVVENEWRKLDGTLATFLVFQAGEPDGGTDENCLRTDSAGFEDRECTDQRDYVCECPAP